MLPGAGQPATRGDLVPRGKDERFLMPKCEVEITGKDGLKYKMALNARSSFDAADQAMQSGLSLLWWYDPDAPIIVRRAGQEWTIPQERIREWRKAKG